MTHEAVGAGSVRAFAMCAAVYLVAAAVAIATAVFVGVERPVHAAFWADVAATITVFAFSRGFDNSSFYDPYWSVAPLPIALFWLGALGPESALEARVLCVLALVTWWGARLTYNWARSWSGIDHEDWRYRELREKLGRGYWAISFLGIHMLPTLLVFLGCLPLLAVFSPGAAALGPLDALALAATAGAIALESRADRQLVHFRRTNTDATAILKSGVWSHTRHPNYLGEVGFWWGLYLFALAANPTYWWTGVGAVSITLLFRFVSLPLMESRMLERRPQWAEHAQTTPILVPNPFRARRAYSAPQ